MNSWSTCRRQPTNSAFRNIYTHCPPVCCCTVNWLPSNRLKPACLSSVLQVWTRRTSSCPRAPLCPAGGALATVRPVRSRSSAAPAASRDPASRRSSDRSEDARPPPPPPPLRLHSPPLSLPGLTLHSTFYSFYFLLRLHGHCSGRSDFVFCIEEEYFRIFVLLETFIQIFHLKEITQRWRRSFASGVCVLSTPSESPAATVVTHVKLLKEADGDTIWTSRSCSLDISQMGRNHREKFCSLIHRNTSLSLRSDFTLQCEPDGPNDSSCGGGRATCSDI